jgi:methylmalonyl-CoA/ethylmalonyl-CoA epimerase
VSAARRKGASTGPKRASRARAGRGPRTPAASEGAVRKAQTSRRGPVTAISHVAIATANADALADTLAAALGAVRGEEEMIDEGELRVLFVHLGPLTLELLEPRSVHHTVARFLGRRGPGLHHVSLDVSGIEEVLARCRDAGVGLIDETPRAGAHGTRVAFLHPKGLGGVLLELCERPPAGRRQR